MRKIIVIMGIMLGVLFSIGDEQYNASEVDSEVVDLTGLSPDQIAQELDTAPKEQNFITLEPEMLEKVSGVKLTEVRSTVDYSEINSTMWGYWGVYKIDGHYVFCIEPGSDTLSAGLVVSGTKSKYNKFKESTRLYLDRVISSGVEKYNNSGNVDYIFSTQLLIWDYLSTNERDVIGNPMESWNPNFLDGWTIHKPEKYKEEIGNIENDLASWDLLPSFVSADKSDPVVHTLKYNQNSENYSITLNDKNKVWDSKYANYEDFGNYTVSNPAGSDNVKISSKDPSTIESGVRTYSWEPTLSGTEQLYDAGQDIIRVGAGKQSGYMKVKTDVAPTGGFKLSKVSKSLNGETDPLVNVQFTVTSSTYPSFEKVYTTGIKGKVTTEEDELKLGKYHIVETKVDDKYVGGFEQDFEVKKPNQIVEINDGEPIVNEVYKNKIQLRKVGQTLSNDSDELIDLSGAEFDLYKDNNEDKSIDDEDTLVQHLVTGEKGKATSKDVVIGQYLLIETKAPTGYQLDSESHSVVVENDGETNKTISFGQIENKPITSSAHLTKVGVSSLTESANEEQSEIESESSLDEDLLSVKLEGVEFEIYQDLNQNQLLDEEERVALQTIVTDENGEAYTDQLKYGEYFALETNNPNLNYAIANIPYYFEVHNLEQVEINDGNPIENEEKFGQLEVHKQGKQINGSEDVSLANAEYEVYSDEDELIETLITDEDGLAVSNPLSFGSYTIKETSAPEGYEVDETILSFEINEQNYKQPIVLKFTDQVITNIIDIKKTDVATGEEIAGAEIEVIDLATKEVVEAWTSTTEEHSFNLDYGQYKFCEKTAPAGYKRETKCTNFEVAQNGVEQQFELTNEQIKMAITGIRNNKGLLIAITTLAILWIVRILYKRIALN